MSNLDDYNAKLATLQAIADDEIKTPESMPVKVFVQEAENLYEWCQPDMDILVEKGLVWDLATDIPVRAGALREAESRWGLVRFGREEAAQQWAEESPPAYELRDRLLHEFRFAYRDDPQRLKKIKDIADGYGHPDMLQDLNDLSVMGKTHPEPLTVVAFDMTLLDQAAQLADELASLYAVVTGERESYNAAKKIRDQAYTHLRESVDRIYAYGQYAFWRNEKRLQGYSSSYLRKMRQKQLKAAAEAETPTTVEEPPEQQDVAA